MSFGSVKGLKRANMKSRENVQFLRLIAIQNIMHLQQLKGMQSSKQGM